MKTKLRMGLIAVAAVTVAALALAARANAQSVGQYDRGGDDRVAQWRAGPRLGQNIQPRRQANQVRRATGPYGFVMHSKIDVSVTENDDGVTIHLTTKDADIAKKLQENLPERIEQLRERARSWAERREQIRERREERGLELRRGLNLLASDEVRTEVVPTDAGVDILIVSDDRDVVAQIKEIVPQHIEQMKTFRKRAQAMREHVAEHPGAMLRGAQMLNLMLSPEVETELTETDKGMVIELSSDNPELAEKLKAVLPERLENLRQLREKMGEAGPALMRQRMMQQRMMQQRKRMEGPGRTGRGGIGQRQMLRRQQGAGRTGRGGTGERQMLRRQQGAGRTGRGGTGERQMLRREQRPAEERMRQITREEIRRYLEEEGME